MLAGYKICPRCRRSTRLERSVCGHCGYLYERRTAAPGQTQIFRARPPRRSFPVTAIPLRQWPAQPSLLAVAGLFLTLCGLLIGLSMHQQHHSARTMLCSHHLPDAAHLPTSLFSPVAHGSLMQEAGR